MDKAQPLATDAVNRLIQEFAKLPGIGPKSAQRITYYLLRASSEQAQSLSDALLTLRQKTQLCSCCYNISDADLCIICRNPQRNPSQVLIVEQPQDILALEHMGIYKGHYHVLHGAISPTEGVGGKDIRLNELLARLSESRISEVIIGTNPTLEGDTTAMYIKRLVTPLGLHVTRLARGLPFGSELEYADDVTLSRAIEGRQEF
ncbi:MAG: recombination mediator RecR [Dehalococcoidia bacterium]|nr:recombination mediator RecR [Dehalococcoidia bacterium]